MRALWLARVNPRRYHNSLLMKVIIDICTHFISKLVISPAEESPISNCIMHIVDRFKHIRIVFIERINFLFECSFQKFADLPF